MGQEGAGAELAKQGVSHNQKDIFFTRNLLSRKKDKSSLALMTHHAARGVRSIGSSSNNIGAGTFAGITDGTTDGAGGDAVDHYTCGGKKSGAHGGNGTIHADEGTGIRAQGEVQLEDRGRPSRRPGRDSTGYLTPIDRNWKLSQKFSEELIGMSQVSS